MELYKKMGNQIKSQFDSKIDKLITEDDKGRKRHEGSTSHEMQEELNQKYKERMSEIGKENACIDDLFRKYNIWMFHLIS